METLFDVGSEPAVNVQKDGRWDSTAYGAVAEQLAIAELLRRGHRVAVPVCDDDGVDLVVDYRVRVQVKNAHRRRLAVNTGYVYSGCQWSSKRRWREADVFLLHGEGRWWVVPASELVGHGVSLALYEGSARGKSSRIAGYEDAWDVFDGP